MDDIKTIGCVLLAILVAVGGCTAITAGGCVADYSDGSRAGTVTSLSRKGLIWKSWEGQMVLGGVRSRSDGNGGEANVFEFNADEAVVKRIQEAMLSGERVELVYTEWLIGPLRIGDSHVVRDVRAVEQSK